MSQPYLPLVRLNRAAVRGRAHEWQCNALQTLQPLLTSQWALDTGADAAGCSGVGTPWPTQARPRQVPLCSSALLAPRMPQAVRAPATPSVLLCYCCMRQSARRWPTALADENRTIKRGPLALAEQRGHTSQKVGGLLRDRIQPLTIRVPETLNPKPSTRVPERYGATGGWIYPTVIATADTGTGMKGLSGFTRLTGPTGGPSRTRALPEYSQAPPVGQAVLEHSLSTHRPHWWA